VSIQPGESSSEPAAPLGRPRADELLEAVREFLATDVLAVTEGHLHHQIRVAINVLALVERELISPDSTEESHRERLAQVGVRSDQELVDAIKSGSLDESEALREVLTKETQARLEVANPKWLLDARESSE
jgi:hypothetical protein